jgi:hypothetical protein
VGTLEPIDPAQNDFITKDLSSRAKRSGTGVPNDRSSSLGWGVEGPAFVFDEYHACPGNRIKVIERCGFVTGHDFSRAAKCLKIKVGFSPCGIFPFHYRFLFASCPMPEQD